LNEYYNVFLPYKPNFYHSNHILISTKVVKGIIFCSVFPLSQSYFILCYAYWNHDHLFRCDNLQFILVFHQLKQISLLISDKFTTSSFCFPTKLSACYSVKFHRVSHLDKSHGLLPYLPYIALYFIQMNHMSFCISKKLTALPSVYQFHWSQSIRFCIQVIHNSFSIWLDYICCSLFSRSKITHVIISKSVFDQLTAIHSLF